MKKSIFLVLFSIFVLTFSVSAQDDANRYSSGRLDNLVNQLKGQTVDLADRASENVRRENSSRADIEAAFLAQQLDASVGFYQQFIRDGRRAPELRDGAAILTDLARRAPSSGANNSLWRDVQNTINDINRELGGNTSGGGNNTGGGQASGRAFWRGMVDNEVHLVIQRRRIEIQTISGTPYQTATSSFTSSLPTRNVTVEAIKKSGRGEVRVIEQPTRANDYTAVIQIIDAGGGAREYQLEIVWR